MTLIDVICKGRAFSRGWETPNDHFPLPAAQSLTQFYCKFVFVFFFLSLFISDRCFKERRRDAVRPRPPAFKGGGGGVRMWVSEPAETAGLLQGDLRGGCALGTESQGA